MEPALLVGPILDIDSLAWHVSHTIYPQGGSRDTGFAYASPDVNKYNNNQTIINFYVRLLNATITCEGPIITFLRYDYEHHRIAIVAVPDAVPNHDHEGVGTGMDHISFAYKTLTDLARTYIGLRDLEEDPIKPIWTVNHGPTTSLYYRDPDRNKIELQVDNFERPEDANAFMGGERYVTNPIGTDFDVEEWAEYILQKANPDGK